MNYQPAFQSVSDWLQNSMAWFSNSTSAMDLHTAIICAGVFVISALVVYLISVFGMRERTYEEAIEEQRRRNQEALQQAKTDKNKKEKKFKKWGKKTKEKNEEERNPGYEVESKSSEELDSKIELSESNCTTSHSLPTRVAHVKKPRQRKQDKGDECLQQLSSSEETDEPSSFNNPLCNDQPFCEDKKVLSVETNSRSNDDFKLQAAEESTEHLGDSKEKTEENDSSKPCKKSPVKKNKKNKSDSLESTAESMDPRENKIINVIKSANLTEEEIQHIVDALSGKQRGVNAEKKKNDSAVLKKLIQEKEDALKSEQKSCQAANERINELQQEINDIKAQASGTEKSLRETLKQEQQEIKALHAMMQRKHDQYASEMNSLQSKMQQMKNKLKEEHALALQRSQEENSQLQSLNRIESEKQQRSTMELSRLQHEIEQLRSSREKYETHQAAMQQNQEELHHQIQQLEKHIEQLVNSHQEEEYSYKQRINEMSNKIQQTENSRSSLVQELQNAQSVCSSLEADNSSLRQRLEEAKHKLNSSEQEIMKLQNRLEESNRQQIDLGNCLEKLREEVMDLTSVKCEHLQVIQSLKKDNEVLATQVTQNIERMAGDGTDEKQQTLESPEMQSINMDEHNSVVHEKENIIHRLLEELEQCRCEVTSLSSDLVAERQLNQSLVDKNSGLSEALKKAEERLQDVMKSSEEKVQEAQRKADSTSKEMQNTLNEQIKEVEHTLRESYSKELDTVREEAESIRKEAEERLLKAEIQANLRLEEFQESLYERLNQINVESEAKVKEALVEKEKAVCDLENFALSLREFLQRIFPSMKVPKCSDNKLLWSQYEAEVISHIKASKLEDLNHGSKDIDGLIMKLEENEKEKSRLECKIKNSDYVLAETEKILKNLQSNVEEEEKKWKKELQSKSEILTEALDENEKLKLQNRTLQTNLEQLKGLKEMEAKLIELQSRLQMEEIEKLTLVQKSNEALYEIEELRLKLQKEELEKKLLQEKLGVIDSLATSISVSDNTLMQIPEVNGASGKK
ncbi:kinectin-like isoform X2 [Uloborus diversus]|uniref:kinectin-like isoform X2 n=1 Tax=Uloborus diversus TaxID=327109 RepID=UPI0024094201|nr:kinectin-like isoform X2 [Uloborus diversus]